MGDPQILEDKNMKNFPVIPAAKQILKEEGCTNELIENLCNRGLHCNRRGPPGSCGRCEPETIEKSGIKHHGTIVVSRRDSRRRLETQRLINRFIRESIPCQNS